MNLISYISVDHKSNMELTRLGWRCQLGAVLSRSSREKSFPCLLKLLEVAYFLVLWLFSPATSASRAKSLSHCYLSDILPLVDL